MREAIKSALILGSVGAGAALIYSGITGWRIPFLETGEAAQRKRILEGDIFINRLPLFYDPRPDMYTMWDRGQKVPKRRGDGPQLPREKGTKVEIIIEQPTFESEFEDAKQIVLRIQNLGDKKVPESYISVVAVEFPGNPKAFPEKKVKWAFTRPLQGVPSISPGKEGRITLFDRYPAGEKKGLPIGMKNEIEGELGDDNPNIGLSVTLFSDWTGGKIVATKRVLTRVNEYMKMALADTGIESVDVARLFWNRR